MNNTGGKKEGRDFGVINGNDLPTDTVQVIKFCPMADDIFAAGGWDEHYRLYKIGNGGVAQVLSKALGSPILDIAWSKTTLAYVGLGSGEIQVVSAEGNSQVACQHPGVICLLYAEIGGTELLFSLGVNKQLVIWRLVNGQGQQVLAIGFDKIPNCMDIDLQANFLLIGVGSHCALYPLDRLQKGDPSVISIPLILESQLSFIRIRDKAANCSVPFNPRARKIVACGTDGRVYVGELSLENFKTTDLIVFKAHLVKDQSIFPVNGLGMSRLTDYSMYTVGSDGQIIFWDIVKKGKLSSYITTEGFPITCADISVGQQYLAFATGYDWSRGVWGLKEFTAQRPGIFIHNVLPADQRTA